MADDSHKHEVTDVEYALEQAEEWRTKYFEELAQKKDFAKAVENADLELSAWKDDWQGQAHAVTLREHFQYQQSLIKALGRKYRNLEEELLQRVSPIVVLRDNIQLLREVTFATLETYKLATLEFRDKALALESQIKTLEEQLFEQRQAGSRETIRYNNQLNEKRKGMKKLLRQLTEEQQTRTMTDEALLLQDEKNLYLRFKGEKTNMKVTKLKQEIKDLRLQHYRRPMSASSTRSSWSGSTWQTSGSPSPSLSPSPHGESPNSPASKGATSQRSTELPTLSRPVTPGSTDSSIAGMDPNVVRLMISKLKAEVKQLREERALMQASDPRREKYLKTLNEKERWKKEVARLRKLCDERDIEWRVFEDEG